jgi:hypothetical protein
LGVRLPLSEELVVITNESSEILNWLAMETNPLKANGGREP